MIKNKKIFLLLLPLFFFLTCLNVNASEIELKDSSTGFDNFGSNLTSIYGDFSYSNRLFLKRAQQTKTDNYNHLEFQTKYSSGDLLNDFSDSILYANKDNISSFVYSFYQELPYELKAGKKYEFHYFIKTPLEVYKPAISASDETKVLTKNIYLVDGSSDEKYDTDFLGYYFAKKKMKAVIGEIYIYNLCIQLIPKNDISKPYFVIGDSTVSKDTIDPFSDKDPSIWFLENKEDKNLAITYAGGNANEVSLFSTPEDFKDKDDGETGIFDNLATCDALDIGCHFGNLIQILKNIINKILDFLSYLFIPRGDFLENQFNAFKKFMSEKLGILVYPIELLFDVLNRFTKMSSGNTIINIPNIDIGWFGTIIKGRTFNIAEYWSQAPYNTIYNIYLAFVHFFIGFCLYKLCCKKYDEIVGGGVS